MTIVKEYNKLVRDKDPDVMRAKGLIPHTRIITDPQEILREARKKLTEETAEVLVADTPHKIAEEIGDLEDAIQKFMEVRGITRQAVRLTKQKKHRKRGGFEKNVFLVTVTVPDGVEDGQR